MEKLKAWATKHKALAIGGGIAVVVLLYLLLKGGGASQPASGGSALNAYYAAQAAGAGDTASTAESANALQAASQQTNAAEAVGIAQYQASLDAITTQANLTAYQDYLSEVASAAKPFFDAAEFTDPTTGDKYVQTQEQVNAGDNLHMFDITTGKVVNVAAGGTGITSSTPFVHGNFDPTTGTFTPVNLTPTPPLQFGQFAGLTPRNLAGTTPATQPTA